MSIQGKDSFSLGDEVIPSKRSTNILDPEGKERKGRPPTKRRISLMEKAIKKKRQTKKKPLSKQKYKEVEEIAVGHHVGTQFEKVEEIAVGHHIGTQESVANLNSHPSYTGHSMWPNMIPHNMPLNTAQGGSIFPFFSPLCPIRRSFNQFMPSFPSSQSFFNDQVWMGQSNIVGSEVWQGSQPSQVGRGEQPSFMEMMKKTENSKE
ncbi:uncharacterized protein LOC130750835 [Actinidia eriantha]|uniref:uncharacterized protein LOC130750835 n=1 Tax=Actinidia eriantha TaxID=165200 RepID=UPI0025900842|nr:uncharacterized protein LOC130750835 [Actinidia eriantha]